jgi:hypothetical protein
VGHTTPTDSRSQRIRASRRGGQILTRALSSSYVTGLPSLRAPRCPGPGWSHHSASHVAMTETGGTTPFIPDTNLLERLFLEERRRTKIVPHAFGERPVLKLMYAAVIRAADRWRGITVGEFEQRQLRAIREELNRAHAARVAPAVTAPKAAAVRKLRS